MAGNENEEFEFRLRAEQEAMRAPLQARGHGPLAPQRAVPSLAMAPMGGAEMLLKAGTGALASIPAGLAYGGSAIAKAAGANVNPADVQNRVQNYLTYQPLSDSAKAGGQAASDIVRPFVEPIAKKYGEATSAVEKRSPFAADLMRAAPGALQAASAIVPLASGARAAKTALAINKESKALAAMRPPTPEQAAVNKAKDLGLKLLPSQQGRAAGALAEGLSGQAKLERTLSKQNARIVDAAAAEEIGLPKGARPTRESIAVEKKKHGKVYEEVAKLGPVTTDETFRKAVSTIDDRSGSASFAEDTPASVRRLKEVYGSKAAFDSADGVAKVRQLRADASSNIKAHNAPEQNALGYAQRKVADAIDDQMERAAWKAGNADLGARYKSARRQLAKLHSVEDAIRGQNVSAKALHQQLQRKIPLSGKLRTVAESYGSFDRVLQDVSKLRNTGPLDVVDYLVGAGAAIHNPLMAAAALSRPVIRAGLASDLYQGVKRYSAPRLPTPTAPSLSKTETTRQGIARALAR